MIRPVARPAPAPESATLHRRRAPVVVRAPGPAREPVRDPRDRRRHTPTLPGLGFRPEADTLPVLELVDDEAPPPVSLIRAKSAPRTPRLPPPAAPVPDVAKRLLASRRQRPVTLFDDVHDDVAKSYLEEAKRLLASGMFEPRD